MNRVALFLAVWMPLCIASAQEPDSAPPAPASTAPPLLQRPYEAVKDFFNYYGLANFIYDTNGSYVTGGTAGSSTGIQAGGGVSGFHEWATGQLSLSYRGTYRDYFSNSYGNGNDQSLLATAEKRWKRWTLNLSETGGLLLNEGAVYGSAAPSVENPSIYVTPNNFSTQTRYLASELSATYIHSYRLSFTASGSYILTRYNSGYSVGNNSFTGAFTTNYRLTKRTTVGGTYSHSVYQFQRNNGSNSVDSIYASLSHYFTDHVQLSLSGGGSRTSGSGAVVYPFNVVIDGKPEILLALVPYKATNYLPYATIAASKQFQHSSAIFTGSEAVTPGNGQYLTSRSLTFNGLFVHELKRSNISVGAYYSRLGAVSSGYSTGGQAASRGVDASYSYNLRRHLGLNARYDYLNFSNFESFSGRADNRLSFGFYLESKDIPLGLY